MNIKGFKETREIIGRQVGVGEVVKAVKLGKGED